VSGVDAVVVAAGLSMRMGGGDKLGLLVAGRPVLAWTLAGLTAAPIVRRIVVVTAAERLAEVAAAPWLPARVVAVVEGGARRQDSVAAGVGALGDGSPDDVILVHDGARPLVSPDLVARVAAAAAAHGAAIPVVPVAETLKRIVDGQIAATVDRTPLAAAQTPQGVRRDVLARAWAQRPPGGAATWTDEAALLEACRIPVHAVPGESTNLKVTLPDDLARVEAALVARGDVAAAPFAPRVGFGDDGHPFGPGAPLALGGLVIEGAPRLHGHSDGDVALHAVCEALLGAAGLGDLGRLFPAGPATPAGIASTEMLAACLARVAAAGYSPVAIDLTLVGARPRLAGHLDAMATAIAARVGLSADRVNVKASTGNLAGFEGAGRGISARAVAVVVPSPRGLSLP
jgi:2-C-methyl-D-erythritol 4-phosphate cytidylyltransferase / 2-C-methyl-D-erythritol 2,4-cyclodiphosphate synthase